MNNRYLFVPLLILLLCSAGCTSPIPRHLTPPLETPTPEIRYVTVTVLVTPTPTIPPMPHETPFPPEKNVTASADLIGDTIVITYHGGTGEAYLADGIAINAVVYDDKGKLVNIPHNFPDAANLTAGDSVSVLKTDKEKWHVTVDAAFEDHTIRYILETDI